MPQKNRDEFIRQLWLSNFDFVEDLPSAHLFRRVSDGAEVLVPKRAIIEAEPVVKSPTEQREQANASPCCHTESRLRGVFSGITLMRCNHCLTYWERPGSAPRLQLVL